MPSRRTDFEGEVLCTLYAASWGSISMMMVVGEEFEWKNGKIANPTLFIFLFLESMRDVKVGKRQTSINLQKISTA